MFCPCGFEEWDRGGGAWRGHRRQYRTTPADNRDLNLSHVQPDESFDFYTAALGFTPVARWPKGVHLLAGSLWVALVLDPETRPGPLPEYTHIAFTVSKHDFAALSERVRASGAALWQDNWTEGESLYFLDPNGHKLEVHVSDLAARLQAARQDPWEGLELFTET